MIRLAFLLLSMMLGLLVLAGVSARAQDSAEPPSPPAMPRGKVVNLAPAAVTAPKPVRALAMRFPGAPSLAAEPVAAIVNKTVEMFLPVEAKDVIVGNPDIADVVVHSPTQLYLIGRAPGQTNVFILDRSGTAIRRLEVTVAIDALALGDLLRQVLPDERNLKVSAVADSVYLSGSVRSEGAAAMARALSRRFVAADTNVVNLLRVGNDQQVLIQVKVVEMQKTVLKELGVGFANAKNIALGHQTVTGLKGGVTGVDSTFNPTGSAAGVVASTAMFGSATIAGLGALTATLDVLENQGLVRTLVEPNLTAVSGETANMLAGGETPTPVAQQNGAISLEYKPFGVALSFTPVVLDAGRLSMKMATEVSSLDPSSGTTIGQITVKGLKVRRASTTVEMPSGGSLMIAGLLQNDITSNMAGVPGLMDVPVLGALFRSSSFQRNESELVVIVSAYVVQPLEKPDLVTPSDGFAPSSDLKRLLLGRLQETYTKRGAPPPPPVPGALQGPFGYIVQ
jgi:pilus assembly protein CpaC